MDEGTKLASEADLFGSESKRRYAVRTLPVSGRTVRIQSLSERELSAYQAETFSASGTTLRKSRLEDANRRLIVLCLVDAAGNRLLNRNHVNKLAEWDAADTNYLYGECAAHVGIKREDIEDLVKNSERINVEG